MLQQVVWFLHIGCALCIIILVLLQYGKGAEMGAAVGGASQTIFGSRGSGSFFTKLTTMLALIFAITSISLSFFIKSNQEQQKISEIIKKDNLQTDIFAETGAETAVGAEPIPVSADDDTKDENNE